MDLHEFESGAVRSKDADDTRYDLISPVGLEAVARTCSEGAFKYGDLTFNSSAEWQPCDGRDFRPDRIPAEAADVLITLFGIAGMRGFDLNVEVDKKMKINRGRV